MTTLSEQQKEILENLAEALEAVDNEHREGGAFANYIDSLEAFKRDFQDIYSAINWSLMHEAFTEDEQREIEEKQRYRKFKGHKSSEQVITDAQALGFEVDTQHFDRGGDWIWLRDMEDRMVQIKFNVCTGWFAVFTPESGDYSAATHSSELDGEEWYDEILNLLYIPKD